MRCVLLKMSYSSSAFFLACAADFLNCTMLSGYFHFGNNHVLIQLSLIKDVL